MPSQRIQVPIIGGEAISRSVVVNNQETVNFITAVKGRGAKAPIVLETAPGYVDLGVAGNGPIRTAQMLSTGIRPASTQNDLVGVYGSQAIAHTADIGNLTIGSLNSSGGRVVGARGRQYIMLVDGTDGYTWDGTTFAQITDLDFPGQSGAGSPTHCVYLDGFFIVNDALTDNFFISAVEDPTSWNALDFEAAAVAPDAALALAATESILWIVGDETAQGFYNSGNPDFPYSVILNATQEVGILAPYSIAESDDGIFYLATTPEGGRFIYQISGQAGRVVSNDEQEAFLASLVDPADCFGFIYKQAGKSFYVLQCGESSESLHVPGRTSSCLVYNIKASAWETREINDGTAWRAGGHGILDNENIVGSRLQGRYGRLDLENYQDSGQEMIRRRRTQMFHSMRRSIDFWSLELDFEAAPEGTVALGAAAQIRMRYSNDAGRTWSDWLYEDLGGIGQYFTRVIWEQLGSGRERVFEIEMSDAANLTLVSAYAEIELDAD